MKTPNISDAEMTDRMRAALRRRYADRVRYCLLEEVGNGTGSHNSGWADAVIMHLWPSDGLAMWGVEIKASRTDWKKELAHPQKSEKIAQHCDAWIVLAPKGLVRAGERPEAWGLWEFDPETDEIRTVSKPLIRSTPKYIHRRFFASLLRRTQDTLPAVTYMAMGQAVAHREARRALDGEVYRLREELKTALRLQAQMREALEREGFVWSDWSATLQRKAVRA